MTPVASATLGLVFLGLGFASVFLMFHLWGYPFDKVARKSAAPRSLMLLHRSIGYAYALVYVIMMFHMVPRMWEYQVELPPRTVAHLLLGFTIGVILILKIAIMRFFRHLEEWMPYLGTSLLLCTVLLLGLSVPFAFRERALASAAAGGDVFSASNRARIEAQIAMSEIPAEAQKMDLASMKSLEAGRGVLLDKCVKCHDLKTILARPRTASDWYATVSRMAEKPALFAPISDAEVLHVSAYLVAITPDLQRSKKKQREQEDEHQEAMADMGSVDAEPAMMTVAETPAEAAPAAPAAPAPAAPAAPAPKKPEAPAPDPKLAKATFARVCSQCHELSDVDDAPPKSEPGCGKLISRMIGNGMTAKATELRVVKFYLLNHYVKKTI